MEEEWIWREKGIEGKGLGRVGGGETAIGM